MVKRCQWGLCNLDNRYPDRLVCDIEFISFPKPKRDLEKCKRCINACGRPHEQLNANTVKDNNNIFLSNILADLNSLCYRSDNHIIVHVFFNNFISHNVINSSNVHLHYLKRNKTQHEA